MRKKMVNDKYTSLDAACHQYGEEQIKKMAKALIEPVVCPKPNCSCNKFIKHEDGYQCLNCFKIIYVKQNRDNGHKKNRQLILI